MLHANYNIKVLLPVIILLLSFQSIHASKSDSLVKLFSTTQNLEEKAYISGKIISSFKNEFDSAAYYSKKYIAYFKTNKSKFGEAYVLYYMGCTALETSHYEESKDYLNKGIV